MSGGGWKRPSSVPVPSIWRTCKGNVPLANGKIPRFRIQDCTEEMKPEIVEYMMTYYLPEEPVFQNLNFIEETSSHDTLRQIFREFLDDNISLVAILDNAEELEDKSLPTLAGCNVLGVTVPGSQDPGMTSEKGKKWMGLEKKVLSMCDCFKKYDVAEYMYAFGLSVHPAYRGQGVGLELLKGRFDVGPAVGLKLTVTVFTATASIILAERAGFETLATLNFEDHKDEQGQVIFKNMKLPACRLMAAVLDGRWKQQ